MVRGKLSSCQGVHPGWQRPWARPTPGEVHKDTLKRVAFAKDLLDGYCDLLRYLVSEHTSLRVRGGDAWCAAAPTAMLSAKQVEAFSLADSPERSDIFGQFVSEIRFDGRRVPGTYGLTGGKNPTYQ